jgi:hypothetical protein
MAIRFIKDFNGFKANEVARLEPSKEGAIVGQGWAVFANTLNANKFVKPWGAPESNSGIANYTLALRLKVPFEFAGIRVHNYNTNASGAAGCKIAASVSTVGGYSNTPSNGTWKPVLFGGVQTFTEANAPSANVRWGINTSDILPIRSKPRTDGGSGYILDIWKYTPAAVTGNRVGVITDLAEGFETQGVCVGAMSGDQVTTPPGSFTRTLTGLGPPLAIEFFTLGDVGVKTWMTLGDSTLQGLGGESGSDSASRRLCRDLGMVWVCHSDQGRISSDFLFNGVDKIATVKPDYLYYQPYALNDTDNVTAGYDEKMLFNLSQVMNACRAVGTELIVAGASPKPSLTAPQETLRRSFAATLKAACLDNGIRFIDKDAMLSNYASSTGGYLAGLSDDTVHQNQAGYALEHKALVSLLQE